MIVEMGRMPRSLLSYFLTEITLHRYNPLTQRVESLNSPSQAGEDSVLANCKY